ncbi:MAG: protein translocase subunit SecD [Verrucomicrobiota bacterium]
MVYLIFGFSLLFMVFFVWYLAATQDRMRRWVALATIASLMVVCALSLFRFDHGKWRVNIKPGLDIMGGTQFLVQLGGKPTPAARDQAIEVVRKRIDGMGLAEPLIQPAGENRIIVQIPGVSEKDKQIYRGQLQRVAKLEFRLVHPDSEKILAGAAEGKEAIPFDHEKLPLLDRDKAGKPLRSEILIKRRAEMSGKYVNSAFRSIDSVGRAVVIINFNAEGQKLFGKLTERNIGQRMAIVLDDEVYSAPVIRTAIYGSCEISGGSMTPVEAEELASVLENPLETPVEIVDERGVDPSLGRASVKSGFVAGLIGLIAVMAYMMVLYRVAGFFSVCALFLNIFILLGLLAQFGFTLTMPGVAAMVLTIGMAVDANVLIFERMREEMGAGKPLLVAVHSGFEKAFSSILDSNVTTIIAAVILFWQGSGPIQGFAIVLCLGVLSSMFSALVITRTGFDWLLARGTLVKLSMTRLIGKTKINFLGMKWAFVGLSLFLILLSFGTWLQKGDKVFGVDFTGGDLITLQFEKKIPEDQVRAVASSGSVSIQYQKDPGNNSEVLSIRTPFGQAEPLESLLIQKFPDAKLNRLSLDKVEGLIGKELKQKATVALVLGMIGVFLYVMWRFEAGFALGAIVALLHDVVISMGMFALCGRELSLPVVGAILTIAGYSINDTIIIFDRIREGMKQFPDKSLISVMNTSINETLGRTLNTSGTTLVAVLALFFFGGMVINDFALILIVGIVIGTYSSIFIASPIALWLSKRRKMEKPSMLKPAMA